MSCTLEDARNYEQVQDYAKAAEIYQELGVYDKAQDLYRRLEQQFPFHKDIKFKVGKLLTILKQWDDAIIKLQEAGNVGVFAEERLYLLAECFKQKGMIHAAKEMYVDLLERNYHYKDARKKLQLLESPDFSTLAASSPATMLSSATQGYASSPQAQYQTMQGFAVEDRYTLIEEIGRGGMGIVYKAEDMISNRLVAIKVLPPYLADDAENRVRFFREAELIAQLHHPHIVTVLEVNQRENFLVMEYLSGGTLTAWRQLHPDETGQLFSFIAQILDALHVVHQQNIVHRDMKPDNILIVNDSTAKLTDFGIAHICGATITHTGTHLGTLPYMSPEQVIGQSIDWRSDIYSIGVVLYELLTGSLPFSGSDTSYHHVHTPPPPPRKASENISFELNEIILRCLEKAPARRFQDAKALQQALLQNIQG